MPRTLKLRIAFSVSAVAFAATAIAGLVTTYLTYLAVAEGDSGFRGWLGSWNLGWTLVMVLTPLIVASVAGLLAYLTAARSLRSLATITGTTRRIATGWVRERISVDGDAEIVKLAGAVNGLAEKFQYVDEHRRSLLAEVTHELRRPLNNVQGYAEMVEQQIHNFTGEIQESASAMQRQVETLARQIDGLRILADADSGDLVLNTSPERPADVVKLAVEGHEKRAADRGVQIKLDVPEFLPPVIVDRHRIFQVIGNLLDNAIAHMPAGGVIDFTAKKDGRALQLTVRDSGTGIPDTALPHVFERFYSADPGSTSQRGGFGLGLTVSKQIIEMHGGRIWVESEQGKGTTFYFTLPTARKPALRLVDPSESQSSSA